MKGITFLDAFVDKRLGRHIPFQWVVPTHPECHPGMQPSASSCQDYLTRLLDGAADFQTIDQHARWFHDRGYYWYSTLIKIEANKSFGAVLDPKDRDQLLERTLASVAGIRGAGHLPELLVPDIKSVELPNVQFQFANLKSNRGHIKSAAARYTDGLELVEALPSSRERRQYTPILKMREAQIMRRPKDAAEAINMAESNYSVRTGLVISTLANVSRSNWEQVGENLIKLTEDSEVTSWLYIAEAWFARALLSLALDTSEDAARRAYCLLSKSQYVCVILGLQMTPHPDLPIGRKGHRWDWTPVDVLLTTQRSRGCRRGTVFRFGVSQSGVPDCTTPFSTPCWDMAVHQSLLRTSVNEDINA